jgi:hypothetical protein
VGVLRFFDQPAQSGLVDLHMLSSSSHAGRHGYRTTRVPVMY